MEIKIRYLPHQKQSEVHRDNTRFRVVAAGRRFGKTILAVNELIKFALTHPNARSWYLAPTYRQAESIVWRSPEHSIFHFLPQEFIVAKSEVDLTIKLKNGHLIEIKGADKEDRLRGVGLGFIVLDEYAFMKSNVWQEIIEPMLTTTNGKALFIGTPDPANPHFHDLFKLGQDNDPNYKSWLFYSGDNPYFSNIEIKRLQRTLPQDIFKREYQADFSIAQGLVYDNFKYIRHVIPSYTPLADDIVICSIDPGLRNPTAALWCAWDREGIGRVFCEYYQADKLSNDNAKAILEITTQLKIKVLYYVIDRASMRRDERSGLTVFKDYETVGLRPLYAAPNDADSVKNGINATKQLLHVDPILNMSKLYFTSNCVNLINEIQHYSWYKYRWNVEKNLKEEPRKLHDHLMDALKNMILTTPWTRRGMDVVRMFNTNSSFGY